jgi:signal transduction protein with GAF and PtsI domain|nr:GAF domain-containing protein [Aeromicrobium sp. 9AM]
METPPVRGDEGLSRSVSAVRQLFDAAACSCALANPDGSSLSFAAAEGIGAGAIIGVEVPVDRGLVGWAAMSGQPVGVSDVRADPRFARDIAERTGYVPTTILAAPFFDSAWDVLGVIEVLDPGVTAPGNWALDVLGTLAAMFPPLLATNVVTPADLRLAQLGRRVSELVQAHHE